MNKLILGFALTLSAFNASASTSWIQCEVQNPDGQVLAKARSSDDNNCSDRCNLIYWDEELRLAVNGVFQGPDLLMIKIKDYTNNRRAEKTIEIKAAQQACSGGQLNSGEYKINCEYCQKD